MDPATTSPGDGQLASAHSQRRRLAPLSSDASCPCPLCKYIYIFSFFLSFFFKHMHLLDNCIFYFFSLPDM